MTVRRMLAGAAGVAVVVAGTVVPAAPRAGAVSNLEVGWWWVGQAQAGAAPPPPTVPSGGLWVSADASGAHAFSAVRFALGELEAAPILTLTIEREAPGGGASLLACPITAPWAPVTGGDWTSRPSYNCQTNVQPVRSVADGGNVMAFDLSTLAVGKTIDVALVPLIAPPQPPSQVPGIPVAPPDGTVPATSNTFDITFAAPTDASIAVFHLPDEDEDQSAIAGPPETPPALAATDTAPFAFSPSAPALGSLPEPVATAAPPSGLRRVALPVVPAAATDTRSAARVLAAAVFLGLAAWWYQLTFLGREPKRRRPRLSLYDDPRRALAADAASRPPRAGRPPALR